MRTGISFHHMTVITTVLISIGVVRCADGLPSDAPASRTANAGSGKLGNGTEGGANGSGANSPGANGSGANGSGGDGPNSADPALAALVYTPKIGDETRYFWSSESYTRGSGGSKSNQTYKKSTYVDKVVALSSDQSKPQGLQIRKTDQNVVTSFRVLAPVYATQGDGDGGEGLVKDASCTRKNLSYVTDKTLAPGLTVNSQKVTDSFKSTDITLFECPSSRYVQSTVRESLSGQDILYSSTYKIQLRSLYRSCILNLSATQATPKDICAEAGAAVSESITEVTGQTVGNASDRSELLDAMPSQKLNASVSLNQLPATSDTSLYCSLDPKSSTDTMRFSIYATNCNSGVSTSQLCNPKVSKDKFGISWATINKCEFKVTSHNKCVIDVKIPNVTQVPCSISHSM